MQTGDLLTVACKILGADYISDLHTSEYKERAKLLVITLRDEFPSDEVVDAINYVSGVPQY